MLDYLDHLYDGKTHLKPRELSTLLGEWAVPRDIKLEDEILFWRWGNFGWVRPDQRRMRTEVLDGFLRIADAEDRIILNFARQWGILGLCEHGVPFGHQLFPEDWKGFKFGGRVGICFHKPIRQYNPEPLERWRYYSRQMRAIIALAATVNKVKPNSISIPKNADSAGFHIEKTDKENGTAIHVPPYLPGDPEDWRTLFQDYGPFSTGTYDPVRMAQTLISLVIERWLVESEVGPRFLWLGEKSIFELRSRVFPHGLFSILTIQIMLLINGAPDYSICYSCHRPFFLRKGQSIGSRVYCKDCGTKAARREATKRYYHQERTNKARQKRKRLTLKQVEAIQRAFRKPRPGLVKELAKKYGVSTWAIYKIREGKTWNKDE